MQQWRFIPSVRLMGPLLSVTRRLTCSDPWDHIFGLVGIAQQMHLYSATVDYARDTVSVLLQAMKNELKRDPYALLHYEAGVSPQKSPESQNLKLPSWVID